MHCNGQEVVMTVNEAIKAVEEAIRSNGLNIHMIDRLEIIHAAQKLVELQGNDPHVKPCKVIFLS
jgi:hypothetical protein